MRRLLLPVPRGLAGVLAAGTAVLVFAPTLGYLAWPNADWVAVSAESRQALMLAGPWAAAWSAWCASRFSGPRSILCPASSVRAGAPVAIKQLRVLVTAALAGWLAGLLPAVVATAVEATAGAPDLLVFASAGASLAAFVSLGYTAGVVVPRAAAPVVSLVVSFVPVLAADGLGTVVAPVWTFGVVAGQYENPVVSSFRALFFLSVAICCVLAAADLWRNRSLLPTVPSVRGVAWLALPVALAALAPTTAAPVLRQEDPPRACRQAAGVRVCVHAARSALLLPLADAVTDVAAASGSAMRPQQVLDAALWERPSPETVVIFPQVQQGDSWPQAAVQDIAWQLSGAARCSSAAGSTMRTEPQDLDAAAVSGAVAVWLARQAGAAGPPLTGSPDALALAADLAAEEPSSVRDFLAGHQQLLRSCQAHSHMLP